jgi:hypothetical protein
MFLDEAASRITGPSFNARLLDRPIDTLDRDQGHWQDEFLLHPNGAAASNEPYQGMAPTRGIAAHDRARPAKMR